MPAASPASGPSPPRPSAGFLPQSPGPRTAVDTAWLRLPADLGASWFDTIALPGARTALVTGNATGHGISAATTMGQLRTAIHALAALDLEPDELLARLHDTTGRLAEERAALPPADPLHNETLTASCIYGVYDPITRICTIARAGHPAPIVVHPDGTSHVCDVPASPLLGCAEDLPRASTSFELAEGSILAFYTATLLPEAETDPGLLRSVLVSPTAPWRPCATTSSTHWAPIPHEATPRFFCPVPPASPPTTWPPGDSPPTRQPPVKPEPWPGANSPDGTWTTKPSSPQS